MFCTPVQRWVLRSVLTLLQCTFAYLRPSVLSMTRPPCMLQLFAIGGFMKDMKSMSALMGRYDAQRNSWHQIVVPESLVPARAFMCAASVTS